MNNLTILFPPDVKPVRSGVYYIKIYDLFGEDSIVDGYSYFSTDKNLWYNTASTPDKAFKEYKLCRTGFQVKHWQGILK